MGTAIARGLTAAAGLAGFAAVALGAFGAHALDEALTTEQTGWWETATFYLLVHAVAGLAIAMSSSEGKPKLAGFIMMGGAALFAATLYAMALGAPRWFGAITPIGGVGMLAGWAMITISSLRSR